MSTLPPISGQCAWDARLANGHDNAFDAVRLVLATLVLLEHSYFLVDGNADRDPLSLFSHGQLHSGALAVYMFFALSGFLVTASLLNSKSVSRFMARRVARIVPGFLAATALGCLVVGPLAAASIDTYFRSQHWHAILATTLALKQIGVSGILDGNALTLVHGTLWSIRYELDCYLLLALLGVLGLLRPDRRAVTFAVIAGLLALGMLLAARLPVLDHGVPALLISSPNRWPELFSFFWFGSAFYMFRNHIPKSPVLLLGSTAALLVSLQVGGAYWALLLCGTYIVLFVALSLAAGITVLGRRVDLSYGTYLYGWPIQQLLLFYSGQHLPPLQLFAIALVLTYLAACASWMLIEEPCLRLARSARFQPNPTSPSAAQA